MEPDGQVLDLSKVLVAVHEVMTACLQPRKTKVRTFSVAVTSTVGKGDEKILTG